MIDGLEHLTRRLLVVDDDPALRQMMSWTFTDMGYLVRVAASCQEAMRLASNQTFEYALLDYHLPDGNGLDLMGNLAKQQPGLMSVLMSADPPAIVDSREFDNNGCLTKPVSTAKLHRIFSTSGPCGK